MNFIKAALFAILLVAVLLPVSTPLPASAHDGAVRGA